MPGRCVLERPGREVAVQPVMRSPYAAPRQPSRVPSRRVHGGAPQHGRRASSITSRAKSATPSASDVRRSFWRARRAWPRGAFRFRAWGVYNCHPRDARRSCLSRTTATLLASVGNLCRRHLHPDIFSVLTVAIGIHVQFRDDVHLPIARLPRCSGPLMAWRSMRMTYCRLGKPPRTSHSY